MNIAVIQMNKKKVRLLSILRTLFSISKQNEELNNILTYGFIFRITADFCQNDNNSILYFGKFLKPIKLIGQRLFCLSVASQALVLTLFHLFIMSDLYLRSIMRCDQKIW